ncbi:methyl-accepting chemotaxis protein [Poseidonibacter sp.]|uniref:methyl-accepting chemotaxis protein n=1 Tax=Poseidonibacter sp. TaxID=2321188 RepID=UPI003C783A53
MLKNLSTRKKLLLLPILYVGIVLVSALTFSYYNELVKNRNNAAMQTESFIEMVLNGRISVYQFLRDPSSQTAQHVQNDFGLLSKSVSEFKSSLTVEENRILCDEIVSNSKKYLDYFDDFSQKRINDIQNGIEKESSEINDIIKNMANTGKILEHKLAEINKSALLLKEEASNTLVIVLIIIAVVSIIVFIIFSMLISNIIVSALDDFKNGLLSFFAFLNRKTKTVESLNSSSNDEFGEMAKIVNENITDIQEGLIKDTKAVEDALIIVSQARKGNLGVQLNTKANNPQLIELSDALNSMISGIKTNIDSISVVLKEFSNYKFINKVDPKNLEGDMFELISNVNFLTDEVSGLLKESLSIGLTLDDASDKLILNVDSLNRSSNEAAASLEETAAALEEITSTIINNAENVSKMSLYANELGDSAKKGQALAQNTTTAMDEITEQVTLINESISIIDQIAFQTNILSLNAAVEAATAGEAGKGFAVVAQEVRNLASRSAEAAKEIKNIVESATSKAAHGKSISADMIKGYDSLLINITKSTEMITEISNASKEQETGITQINDAVTQLDKQTQENASTATQTLDIAIQTDTIAKEIVADANAKEFLGKSDAKIVTSKKEQGTPKILKELNSVKATPKKETPKKIITSNKSDDEWESF